MNFAPAPRGNGGGHEAVQPTTIEWRAPQRPRFALTKFRPTTLPTTLVKRPALLSRLHEGAEHRLTVVVGSAGAGKSVLLSSWAATRAPAVTCWLSCDEADADPVRFWLGFIAAPRAAAPAFGADAAELLAMDGAVSADVTASIANDAAKLPAGLAIVVDDFHAAGTAAARSMTDLVERWPAKTAQLVLSSRVDPPVRLHRLRVSGELCELRDHDLYLSLTESGALLAKYGVQLTAEQLALLHQRSEGWAPALQMAALTLRGAKDPVHIARALEVRSHTIAEYFISEVLGQQPAEVASFMLDTSILDELTADACAAVTGRPNAAVILRSIEAANLFIVALDDDRTIYRYHHLVRQLLRAELRATDPARDRELHLRAAEWFKSTGSTRRAIYHLFAAQQVDKALALLQEHVVIDYLNDPAPPPALDLSTVDPSLLTRAPDRLLALAAELLLWGDWARGGQYLDLLERTQPAIPTNSKLAARLAAMRSVRYALTGEIDEAVRHALTARAIEQRTQPNEGWNVAVPSVLIRAYTYLEDFDAVEREVAAARAMPSLAEPVRLVHVPGAQAMAWFNAGRITAAAKAAQTAEAHARRLGFEGHPFAVDYLRVLAGAALEHRDLDTAEHLTERALSISERIRPAFEFLALLDRAEIWAARGHIRDALATVDTARLVLAGTTSALLARADEMEALLRLSLGEGRSPAELADKLPTGRRAVLLARIALAANDHQAALEHLKSLPPPTKSSPRAALVRQILTAAAAIEREDPTAAGILSDALETGRHEGFLNTVVSTAPQVTSYLIEHGAHVRPDPFLERLVAAALDVHAVRLNAARSPAALIEPLTAAQLRILKLLPTNTYPEIAAALYISQNTVKTHLRAIYMKLDVASRSQAVERAVDLGLL